MHAVFEFPESNQQSPVTLHWYHGSPPILHERGLDGKGSNALFMGDEGMLLCGFSQHRLLLEAKFASFDAPEPFIPDSPGFHREWIEACKGGESAMCNFDYSGPLAETVLLGNVAYRTGGFNWNYTTLKTEGNQDAQNLIRESYRPG